MDIDDLCQEFGAGSLDTLSREQETELLYYSRDIELEDLVEDKHLSNSKARYLRYLEYSGIKESDIEDFLSSKCDSLTMAAKFFDEKSSWKKKVKLLLGKLKVNKSRNGINIRFTNT